MIDTLKGVYISQNVNRDICKILNRVNIEVKKTDFIVKNG